jgi:hypothetical protein
MMATPIKTTPLLKGKDAAFFYKQLAKSSKKFSVKKAVVSANDRRRIASAVSKFLKSKIA